MTIRPMIGPVHHIRLTVSDLDRSRAFYTDVLGFEVAAEFPDGVLLNNGGTLLGLLAAAALGNPGPDRFDERRIELDHLSFSVDRRGTLEHAARYLAARGVSRGEIEEMAGLGIAVLPFRDPDNVQLELTSPIASAC